MGTSSPAFFTRVRQRLDPRRIPRTLLALFDQGLVSGTGFATTVVIGRAGTPAELGLYAVAISATLFARGVQEQLICAPYLVRSHHQPPEEIPAYTGSSVVHQLVLMATIVAVLLTYGLARTMAADPSRMDTLILLLGVLIPFLLIRDYVRQLSFARFNFKSLLVLDFLASATQLALLAGLVAAGRLSASTALIATAIAQAVGTLAWFALRSQSFSFDRSRIRSDWLDSWAFGRWALGSFVVNSAAPLLMPWVMLLAISAEAAGVLAACTSLVGIANTFILGISNYLSPRAANAYATNGLDALQKVLREAALMFSAVVGGLALLILLAGDRIPVAIFGPEYANTGTILLLLFIGALFNSLSITVGNGLWAVNRPSVNFRADAASLTAALIATATLVPSMGVLGAAAASAVAPAVGALVRWRAYAGVVRELRRETVLSPGPGVGA